MKPYWFKERDNPQLGTYYVPRGRMSIRKARQIEDGALYGCNTMHRFDTREAYDSEIKRLRESGASVHPEFHEA